MMSQACKATALCESCSISGIFPYLSRVHENMPERPECRMRLQCTEDATRTQSCIQASTGAMILVASGTECVRLLSATTGLVNLR